MRSSLFAQAWRGHKEFALPLMWLGNRRFWACLQAQRRVRTCLRVSNFYSEAASPDPLQPKKKPIFLLVPPTRQRFMGQLAKSAPPCLIPAPTGTNPSVVWVVIVVFSASTAKTNGGSCSQNFLAAVLDGPLQPT